MLAAYSARIDEPVFVGLEQAALPWEDAQRSAQLVLDGRAVGRVATVPLDVRRRIDEHFTPWSIAVAEIDLSEVTAVVLFVTPM